MDSKYWKYIALGAAAIYVFQVARKNGGTLKGNPEGISIDGDRIVDKVVPWLGLNPHIENLVKQGSQELMNHWGARPNMRTVK